VFVVFGWCVDCVVVCRVEGGFVLQLLSAAEVVLIVMLVIVIGSKGIHILDIPVQAVDICHHVGVL